jgi:hypothetical protein
LNRNGIGPKEVMADLIQMIRKVIFTLKKATADGNTFALLVDRIKSD